MEKNLLQRKSLLLLCLLVFTVLACQKDEHTDLEQAYGEATLSAEVRAAKAWFERSYSAARQSEGAFGLARTSTSSSKTGTITLKPQWESAWVGKDQVVEIPLQLDTKVAYNTNPNATDAELDAQVTRLVVLKDKQGEEFAVLMHIVGEPAYLQKCSYNLTNNRYKNMESSFSGLVLYTYLDGSFCGGWRFEDGAVTKSVKANVGKATERDSSQPVRASMSCTDHWYVEFTQYCWHTVGSGHTECGDWFPSGYYEWTECVDDGSGSGGDPGDGGGGVPGTNPDPPASPEDPCVNIKNMENTPGLNEVLQEYMYYAKNRSAEYSYTKTTEGAVKRKEGVSGHVGVALHPDKQYSTIVHSHDYEEGEERGALFSHRDLMVLYKALRDNNINDVNSFYFVVAGGSGTYGALYISDATKFRTFGERFVNDEKELWGFIDLYTRGVSSRELESALYVQMLNALDSGLTYMQAKDEASPVWEIINEPNAQGQLTKSRCD